MKQIIHFKLVVVALCFFSCQTPQGNTSDKEFEGIIRYAITYENNNEKNLFGDSLIIYYSKGNILKQYIGASPGGMKKEIFLTAASQYFFNKLGSDTLFTYDLRKSPIHLLGKSHEHTDTRILGKTCNKVTFAQRYEGKTNMYLSSTFYYAPEVLIVNKSHFKDWKFGNFDEFIDESGCLYLKLELANQNSGGQPFSKKIYRAISIQPQVVDPAIFLIDTSKAQEFKMD